MGRFQHLKIALEETQVWGLSREMSLRGSYNSAPRPCYWWVETPTEETSTVPTVAHTSLPV